MTNERQVRLCAGTHRPAAGPFEELWVPARTYETAWPDGTTLDALLDDAAERFGGDSDFASQVIWIEYHDRVMDSRGHALGTRKDRGAGVAEPGHYVTASDGSLYRVVAVTDDGVAVLTRGHWDDVHSDYDRVYPAGVELSQ